MHLLWVCKGKLDQTNNLLLWQPLPVKMKFHQDLKEILEDLALWPLVQDLDSHLAKTK